MDDEAEAPANGSAGRGGHEERENSGFPSAKALHMTLALPPKSGVMETAHLLP